MTVQQQLTRHASIQTTMNVYGSAMPEIKRVANSRIVQIVLGETGSRWQRDKQTCDYQGFLGVCRTTSKPCN
jgi:hypothetical protein